MIRETIREQSSEYCRELGIWENNDCAVKAIAQLTDHYYDDVHRLCASLGRPLASGTCWSVIRKAFDLLGFEMKKIDKIKGFGATMATLRLPEGRYLVYTYGHVAAVIDGEVVDPVTKGRKHRPKEIWRIMAKKYPESKPTEKVLISLTEDELVVLEAIKRAGGPNRSIAIRKALWSYTPFARVAKSLGLKRPELREERGRKSKGRPKKS